MLAKVIPSAPFARKRVQKEELSPAMSSCRRFNSSAKKAYCGLLSDGQRIVTVFVAVSNIAVTPVHVSSTCSIISIGVKAPVIVLRVVIPVLSTRFHPTDVRAADK